MPRPSAPVKSPDRAGSRGWRGADRRPRPQPASAL